MSYEFQQELELNPNKNCSKILIIFEETGTFSSILLKANFHLASHERLVLWVFCYDTEPYTHTYIILYFCASICLVSLS